MLNYALFSGCHFIHTMAYVTVRPPTSTRKINDWFPHVFPALDTSLIGLFKKKPTLLWLSPSLGLDTGSGMEFLCLIGIILSMVLLVSQRCRDCLGFFVLWLLYFSLFQVSFGSNRFIIFSGILLPIELLAYSLWQMCYYMAEDL
jgi:hypothetical protein